MARFGFSPLFAALFLAADLEAFVAAGGPPKNDWPMVGACLQTGRAPGSQFGAPSACKL